MEDERRALAVMAVLAAMATARLQGDAAGEALLAAGIESADAALAGQAAAVMVSSSQASASRAGGRIERAASFVSAGNMPEAYRAVRGASLDEAVLAVCAAWLTAAGGDAADAVLLGQQHCSAYKQMLEA